ncbi:MAG: hypothetical protein AAF183_23915 [Pseudomonadota bacterium]
MNAKKVECIWRREGLKVPETSRSDGRVASPKKHRLWLNDGSCIRQGPERAKHVRAYDFVEERTHDGRKFRSLCVVAAFTREALAILVKRRPNTSGVLKVLAELMRARGTSSHIRSDNRPHTPCASQCSVFEPRPPWKNHAPRAFLERCRELQLKVPRRAA